MNTSHNPRLYRSRVLTLGLSILLLLTIFELNLVLRFENLGIASSQSLGTPSPTPDKTKSVGKQTVRDDELSIGNSWDLSYGSDDADCDSIKNFKDNCPLVYNPKQENRDGDTYGDACDSDLTDSLKIVRNCDKDKDGIDDGVDNCPNLCNPDQKDSGENGVGDACEKPRVINKAVIPCKKRPRSSKQISQN